MSFVATNFTTLRLFTVHTWGLQFGSHEEFTKRRMLPKRYGKNNDIRNYRLITILR